jgi:hypothetical protein
MGLVPRGVDSVDSFATRLVDSLRSFTCLLFAIKCLNWPVKSPSIGFGNKAIIIISFLHQLYFIKRSITVTFEDMHYFKDCNLWKVTNNSYIVLHFLTSVVITTNIEVNSIKVVVVSCLGISSE